MWPSWPQACIHLSVLDCQGLFVSSRMGRASISPRNAMAGSVPVGFIHASVQVCAHSRHAICIASSCSRIALAVLCSCQLSSGLACNALRNSRACAILSCQLLGIKTLEFGLAHGFNRNCWVLYICNGYCQRTVSHSQT